MECHNCHRKRGDLLLARCTVCVSSCEYLSKAEAPWITVNEAEIVPEGYQQCVRCRRGCPVNWFKEDSKMCTCCRTKDKILPPEVESAIKSTSLSIRRSSRNQRNKLALYHCVPCDIMILPNSKSGHFTTLSHKLNLAPKFNEALVQKE